MNKRGSILIFTLWVLIILVVLSLILSRRASTDIKLAKYESDNIKATYLGRAGVMKMLAELMKDTNSYDSLNEDWNRDKNDPKKLALRDDIVLYGAFDEERRLNLNGADLEKDHLVALGADEMLSQKILDYRNSKDKKRFEFIEELFLVEGMTKEVFGRLKELVTIYRGDDSKVNINTAVEEILGAIIGNSAIVQDVLAYRKGADGEEGTEDDGIFRDSSDISMIGGLDPALFTVESDVFRIWAQTILSDDEEVTKEVEAIINRSGKIYRWKER